MSARISLVRLFALAAVVMGLGVAAFAAPASAADETTWLCKPGQADDMCGGTIDGTIKPAPGQQGGPLGYTRPADAPVDCFYLYPTQSEQTTPNSDLAKDAPIRRVAVQQARMFSSVCDVYAPMYRQVTYSGSQASHNEEVETAYQSALAGFKDYLENYNDGRGFILIGHSQGSAHTARLIDEQIDGNPELRSRLVGAIAPGANVNVPTGQLVGGMYENVPACSSLGEVGCLVAYSMYKGYPGNTAQFSRLDTGYWIYDLPRPDPATQEVVCVNPAALDGSNGILTPLINFDYLLGVPNGPESAAPWGGQPDFYAAECARENGSHWLNLRTLDTPGDERQDLSSLVASGNNYHVPEVNLAEGNLLNVAQAQTDTYVVAERIADAKVAKEAAQKKLTTLKASLRKRRVEVLKSNRAIKAATKKCRKAAEPKRLAACKSKKRLTRKKIGTKKQITKLNRQITGLNKEIKRLDGIIG